MKISRAKRLQSAQSRHSQWMQEQVIQKSKTSSKQVKPGLRSVFTRSFTRTLVLLNGPKHLCFGPSGEIYLADDVNDAVRKFGQKTGLLPTRDLGDYKIKRPHCVTVRDGWLYIADSFQHRILRVKL